MGCSVAMLFAPESLRLGLRSQMLSCFHAFLLPISSTGQVPAASAIHTSNSELREDPNSPGRMAALTEKQQLLTARIVRLQDENRGLRALARAAPSTAAHDLRGVAARVVARDILWHESIWGLDCGSQQGVRLGAGVLFQDACLGRIVSVANQASCLAPLTHRGVCVAARLADCRAEGILRGGEEAGGEKRCRMSIVAQELKARAGECVVASGLDGSFPAGCWLGTVVSLERAGEMEWTLSVRPAYGAQIPEAVYILWAGEERVIPWPKASPTRK